MNRNYQQENTQSVVPTADEILQYLTENGFIDVGDVRETITNMNIERIILENHSHKVWQNKTDLRWYTYINDPETGKRKLISRKSKKKMMEFLNLTNIEDFKNSNVPTIRKLYPMWLEHKSLMCADTYIPRVQSDWKKYYDKDPIVDVPIASLTKIDLESWVLHLIKDNEMTKTNYYNVSLIIRQIFQFAYDSELIQENPFDRVKKDLGKLFKKVRKPMDETQVYSNEEIQKLEQYIWDDFYVKGRKIYRLAPLAVLFQLYTGMRVSEVCAVKYEDVLPNGNLYIRRMLVKSTGEVREATKGAVGEREIYLSSKARKIIAATLQFRKDHDIGCAEYIFSTSDKPFPERVINDYLERYCKYVGIPYRSSHKLRKTAISSMVNSGVSLNAVRSFAGHVDEETTLKYYTFDRENDEKLNKMLEQALSYDPIQEEESKDTKNLITSGKNLITCKSTKLKRINLKACKKRENPCK